MVSRSSDFRRGETTAVVLALVAGYVDAYAVLSHGVFVSFMSGNTTNTGLKVGEASFIDAGRDLLPIPLFVAGVFAGTLILHSRLRRPAPALLALIAVLIAGTLAGSRLGVLPNWSDVSLLSFAMGLLNTTVTKVGTQSVSLGYVTGTLNNAAQHLALAAKRLPVPQPEGSWDTHRRRISLLLGVWTSFLVGAFLGSITMQEFAVWALLPPVAVLIVVAVLDAAQRQGTETGKCA